MPGTFGLDSPSPQHDVPIAGSKSNIYLPPSTPSASATSSLYLFDTQSTTSTDLLNAGGTMVGRKRMRDSFPHEYGYERGNQFEEGDSNLATPGSPMPFVNTKYRLAGGLDTPQAERQNREMGMGRESDFGDTKYRRELSDVKETFEAEGEGQLYRDENGRPRIRGQPKEDEKRGWIKPMVNVVGGVVGKMWEFCKMGVAFKGFQAGGGNGYVFGSTTPIEPTFTDEPKNDMWEDEKSPGTPVPAGFPMSGMVENYMDRNHVSPQQETTPPRPAKRRQTSFTAQSTPDDMSRNWVVVPPPQVVQQPQPEYQHIPQPESQALQPEYHLNQQYPKLPPVPADAFAIPQSQVPKSRVSQQRSGIARYNSPATSNSTRRHLVQPQITSSNMGATRRPTYQSHPRVLNPSPTLSNYERGTNYSTPTRPISSQIPRTASPAGSRIPRWTPNSPKTGPNSNESPAAREAKAWKAKQLREEREQDEMMRKFDRQMKELIRQGNMALGTKVEDMEVDDEDVY
ncbi:uncharacterized protein EAF01_000982 [Botrytis porri]|uniref:Uncharacterized protein n=1 Tax=Botrytis porri TaxID=87229 RepID=A0A4Z1K5D6_9HELO|nr:uncharacterized protein EAF01_000982 [Botrytis porri]KAF7914576.1 hypothetical protein EAF01_000982 [Botrytis porri]TGO81351.1 hypothetical protein BPOR_1192g00010 [Botrytis porri]